MTRQRVVAFAKARVQAAERKAEERARAQNAFPQGPLAAHRLAEALPAAHASAFERRG